MDEINLSTGWQALLLTTIAAIVLKVVEFFLNKRKDHQQVEANEATEIRKEQRAEISELRDNYEAIMAERDTWRTRYYEAREEVTKAREEMSILRIALERLGVDPKQ